MSNINDGGPAFPHHEAWDEEKPGIGWIGGGMSLRDWFAGQALAGTVNFPDAPDFPRAAKYAYDVADAMLKARGEPLSSEWRPISTAPRDGRWVWLWNKHNNKPDYFYWSTSYSVFGLGGCWTDGLATMGDKIDFDWWTEVLLPGPKNAPPGFDEENTI